MATTRWRPSAKPTAQVSTATVTAYDATTLYSITINGKTISTLGTGGTVNTTATALATLWNAATEEEFTEVTASTTGASGVITFTSDSDDGEPFTFTTAESGGTGTIGNQTDTTSPTGPYHWDNASNWSGGAVPVNSDTVIFDYESGDVRWGLAQTAVTLAELRILASYTGQIGRPDVHENGYHEYRDKYLAIKSTLVNIGQGEGTGSPMLRLDQSSVQTTVRVLSTGAGTPPLPALQWKGTHASNAMYISRGDVGIALLGGETAVLTTLEVGYLTSQESDSTVRAGSGLTLATLQQTGGRVTLEAGLTTVDKRAGTLELNDGAVTTLTQHEGSTIYRGTGTITTLNVYGGLVDFSGDTRTCTVTNASLSGTGGVRVNDPLGRVTWTNAVTTTGPYDQLSLSLGNARTITIA